jgi:predicted nucleic acid-binding protein
VQNLLLDTDVILDFFFDRKPWSDDIARILTLCEQGKVKGFVTPVILGNCYYLLRRTAAHERVITHLQRLTSILDILPIDKEVVKLALNSGFNDFEDALQNFSAVKSNFVDVILTRNTKDYSRSDISVMTPENFLLLYFSSLL